MKALRVAGKLESYAVFSDRPALGNEITSLDFIPGSSLRGGMANHYLRLMKDGKPDLLFREVFGEERVHFPHLVPLTSHVLPLSAATCKVEPGFNTESRMSTSGVVTRHGVVDKLFLSEAATRCMKSECSHSLVPATAEFYRPGDWKMINPEQRLYSGTAITAAGVATEGSLRTASQLTAGTMFSGEIRGDEDIIQELYKKIGREITLYMGKRRQGRVRFEFSEIEQRIPDVEEVIFSRETQTGKWVVLKFETDVILIDRMLRPIIGLTNEIIQEYLGAPRDAKIIRSFVKSRRIAGWSGVGKLFRPDDIAMKAGSVFLIQFDKSDNPDIHAWVLDLFRRGIGMRRGEGYGRVVFNDPFNVASINNEGATL